MAWVWLVLGVVVLGIEALTLAFFALFAGLGLLGASVAAASGAPLWAQVLVVGAVSVLGIAVARPVLLRSLRVRQARVDLPGVQGLVGQPAITVDVVGDEHHPGHALLAGERWLAFTDAAEPLQPDIAVVVAAVHGTTLVVRPRGAAAS